MRLAEFGSCHRNEPSGTLHGLMRVRNFVQDDAHIFCTEAQIQDEVIAFIDLLFRVYKHFGFEDILLKLSTRPEQRVGSDAIWDKAETALEQALNAQGLDWELQPGEGAFYGPKIEFSLKDCLRRVWQCGTIQVDFSMPEKFNLDYIGEDGEKHRPVMVHRVVYGSVERFIGILIEHFAGAFPLWLAPTQVKLLTLNDDVVPYAKDIMDRLMEVGIRAELDDRAEKIGYKIREHNGKYKVPVQLIIGNAEAENSEVNVRRFGSKDQETMGLEEFISNIVEEAKIKFDQ